MHKNKTLVAFFVRCRVVCLQKMFRLTVSDEVGVRITLSEAYFLSCRIEWKFNWQKFFITLDHANKLAYL